VNRGKAEGKRPICREPCPLRRSSNPERDEVASMEKKMVNSEIMYFEDLPANVQELLLDLIVSIIRNTKDQGSPQKKLKKKPKRAE
jgi:hypothetical protein